MRFDFSSFLADRIIRHRRTILAAACILTVASLALISRLRLDSSIDSLLPSETKEARDLMDDLRDTGVQDVLVAMVEVSTPDRLDDGKAVVDAFIDRLAALPSIKSVEGRTTAFQQRFLTDVFLPNAALFLTEDALRDLLLRLGDEGIRRQIEENKQMLLMPMQGGVADLITRDPLGLRALWLSQWMSRGAFAGLDVVDGHLVDKDRRRLLVFIRPRESARNIPFTKDLMASVQSAADESLATWRNGRPDAADAPSVSFAGGYPLALQDEALTRADLRTTLPVSFIGVNLLFYALFRRPRLLILMLAPLAMGVAWAFGALRLALDHINILTGAFGGVILGISTDFAIYFLSYHLTARRNRPPDEAVRSAIRDGARPIAMGGATAVAAFFTLAASSFRGLRELGLVAGLGLLFCLAAMLTVFPALLLSERSESDFPRQASAPLGLRIDALMNVTLRRPRLTMALALGVLCFLGVAAFHTTFDDDMRSLRPRQGGGLSAQEKLEAVLGGAGNYFLLVMEDRDSNENALLDRALRLNRALDRLQADGSLSRYRSALSYLPAPESQRGAGRFLADHAHDLDLDRIEATFRQALLENGFNFLPEYDVYLKWLRTLLHPTGSLRPESYERAGVASLLSPFIVRRDSRCKLITYVYPRAGLWLGADVDAFASDLRKAASEAGLPPSSWRLSGFPALAHYLKQTVRGDIGETVLLSTAAIALLLLLTFRRPLPAALAATPSLAAMAGMLGLMALTSLHINYMNFIVLPLMIGICINDGVIVVSHWERNRRLGVGQTMHQVGPAVVITSLTTLMGFGSLVFSHYPGLRSIGWMAGVGILAELSASVILLPAILECIGRLTPSGAPENGHTP